MTTIGAFIYPDKLCLSHYLGLIELMGIFTLPQHIDPLNLVHNINYILQELLSCTYLWCLLLELDYAWGDYMVPLSFPFIVAKGISTHANLIFSSLFTLI